MILLKSVLQVILLLLLTIVLSSLIFLGMGYLVFSLFPLTLFQSTLLIMGAVFVVAFCVLVYSVSSHYDELKNMDQWDDYEDEYYDEDDDFDKYDDFDDFDAPFKDENNFKKPLDANLSIAGEKKIGRNQPCPCGSGKKYKNCCGK